MQHTKILIAGHNRPVTARISPPSMMGHWWGNEVCYEVFSNMIKMNHLDHEYRHEHADVKTVDLLQGGTFRADLFSDEFINAHLHEFDMVLIPDLGTGLNSTLDRQHSWNMLQDSNHPKTDMLSPFVAKTKNERDADASQLVSIAVKLLRLLKPEGCMCFGKFLCPGPVFVDGLEFGDVRSAMVHRFLEMGCDASEQLYHGDVDTHVFVKKMD